MPWKTAAAAIAILLIAALAVACGGGDSSSGEPSPTGHIKKLSEAHFQSTDLGVVYRALDAAYKAHPDIAQLHVFKDEQPITRESQGLNLGSCQSGLPNDAARGPEYVETGRLITCAQLAANYYSVYQQTGYEEAYQVALAAANYFLTEVPQRRSDFDKLLQEKIQDTSPPGS